MIPQMNAALAVSITSAGSGGTRASSGKAPNDQATRQNGTGRSGRSRSARTLPTNPPIAPPVKISPHDAAPAEVVLADQRPEHEQDPDPDVRHRGREEADAQPDSRPGLARAVGEIGEEALARRGFMGPGSQSRQERGADHEADTVEGEHPAGLGEGDEQA